LSEPILNQIKTLLEVDLSETIFDDQLLLYLNNGIRYLANNKIPVDVIDATTLPDAWALLGLNTGDSNIVVAWLHLYVLQRFDRTLMAVNGQNATLQWIDSEMQNLIYQLKTIYDNGADT
jgi:hypothetical protein